MLVIYEMYCPHDGLLSSGIFMVISFLSWSIVFLRARSDYRNFRLMEKGKSFCFTHSQQVGNICEVRHCSEAQYFQESQSYDNMNNCFLFFTHSEAVKNATGPLLVEVSKTPGAHLGITLNSVVNNGKLVVMIDAIKPGSIADR